MYMYIYIYIYNLQIHIEAKGNIFYILSKSIIYNDSFTLYDFISNNTKVSIHSGSISFWRLIVN